MSDADFTPPSNTPEMPEGRQEASFPLSNSLNVLFSAYEDRLVIRSRRVNRAPINVLLTRRMTMIVLSQLLSKLPELSGLDKTPAQYWQEVLQMAHQNALRAGHRSNAGEAAAPREESESGSAPATESETASAGKSRQLEGSIYLATSLTTQMREGDLVLAFSGLPMPQAMVEPCQREPLFAIPLQVDHVHQMIRLLIDKAQEADWHLPLNLPWLDSPAESQTTTLGTVH